MQSDVKPEWNSKYPICDAGQQFIFACRRTASRLDLSEAEVLAGYARMVLASASIESNVVELAAFREIDDAQSA